VLEGSLVTLEKIGGKLSTTTGGADSLHPEAETDTSRAYCTALGVPRSPDSLSAMVTPSVGIDTMAP
jgi:hypothetical protein